MSNAFIKNEAAICPILFNQSPLYLLHALDGSSNCIHLGNMGGLGCRGHQCLHPHLAAAVPFTLHIACNDRILGYKGGSRQEKREIEGRQVSAYL
jgi:hypothetical protein